eukprot:PhF_6_TR27960/c0_g1_i1/m.41288
MELSFVYPRQDPATPSQQCCAAPNESEVLPWPYLQEICKHHPVWCFKKFLSSVGLKMATFPRGMEFKNSAALWMEMYFFSDVTNSDISQSISSQIVKQVSRRANVTFITSGVGGVNVQETFQSVVANTILQLRKSLESTLINDAEDKMQESNNRVNSYPHGSILGTSIVAQDTKQLMSYGSMAGGTSVPNLNMSSLPRQSRAPTPPTSTRRSIGGQRPASARTVFQTTTLSPRSTSPNQRFLYLTSHSPKYFVPSQAATRMFTPRADSTDQLPSTTRAKVVDDPTTPAQASTRKTPRKQRRCSLDIAKELHNVVDGVMSRIPNSAGRCKLDS